MFSVDMYKKGVSLGSLRYYEVDVAKAMGRVGTLKITIPNTIPMSHWSKDMQFVVRRTDIPASTVLGKTIWLLKKVTFSEEEDTIELSAKCALSILDKQRIVAHPGETTYAEKTTEMGNNTNADRMIYDYLYENLIAPLNPVRALDDLVEVEQVSGVAPSVESKGAWKSLLSVISNINSESTEKGMPVHVDVVYTGYIQKPYRVIIRPSVLGVVRDLSLSPDRGNISDVELEVSWENEVTHVYVGGEGQGPEQIVVEARDQRIQNPTGIDRYEAFITKGQEFSHTVLSDAGLSEINKNRAKVSVSAESVDVDGYRFGLDYDLGDVVNVSVNGSSYECIVKSFRARSDRNGDMSVSVKMESLP